MLIDLRAVPDAADVGGKAARLGWLMAGGYRVPDGAALPFRHAAELGRSDGLVGLRAALEQLLVPGRRYAVRSSANVEDHGERSFAGQFVSVLDVEGVDEALAAARSVVGSLHSERVHAYAARVGVDTTTLRMAVVFQEMARPRVSGVAFSRDPVTGVDEILVEAVAGRGDALVGQGAEPARWRVGSRGIRTAPEIPLLGEDLVAEIVDTVRGVASRAGQPADVEWVWDGEEVHLVQWRPITGLGASPRTWSSRLARDMLPGLIPPLVWSINVPVLSRVWVTRLSGSNSNRSTRDAAYPLSTPPAIRPSRCSVSAPVRLGQSEASPGTYASRRWMATASRSGCPPSTSASPEVGRASPSSSRIVVVLPEPFGPR
jgi:pyruvate, water dikinase